MKGCDFIAKEKCFDCQGTGVVMNDKCWSCKDKSCTDCSEFVYVTCPMCCGSGLVGESGSDWLPLKLKIMNNENYNNSVINAVKTDVKVTVRDLSVKNQEELLEELYRLTLIEEERTLTDSEIERYVVIVDFCHKNNIPIEFGIMI